MINFGTKLSGDLAKFSFNGLLVTIPYCLAILTQIINFLNYNLTILKKFHFNSIIKSAILIKITVNVLKSKRKRVYLKII